jgi:hypothetical protein
MGLASSPSTRLSIIYNRCGGPKLHVEFDFAVGPCFSRSDGFKIRLTEPGNGDPLLPLLSCVRRGPDRFRFPSLERVRLWPPVRSFTGPPRKNEDTAGIILR